ncbi:unnamed protein product [Mucor hiemalis]
MSSKLDIKIGLLLPFNINDDEKTQAVVLGGSAGVRKAMAEINALEIIPGATLTLIEKDSYPTVDYQTAITEAIVSTVSLIQEGVVGVIGDISSSWTALSALMTSTLGIPQCSFSANATSLADKSQYEYFFRTIPTDLLYADAILSFISNQQWTAFGILYPDNDLGRQLTQTLISKSKKMNRMVKSSQTYFDSGNKNNIHNSIDTLMSLGSRIVFIASKEVDEIVSILTIAAHAGHINSETVWITMIDVSDTLKSTLSQFNAIIHNRMELHQIGIEPFQNGAEQVAWTTPNLEFIDYATAFAGGLFTFVPYTNLSGAYSPFDEFNQKWTLTDTRFVNYHTGLAYSCLMVMAHGLGQLVKDSKDQNKTLYDLSIGQLPFEQGQDMISIFNSTGFVGPQGPILFDKNGDTTTGNFMIYNYQNGSHVEIGKILGGTLDLFASPVYFDGTHQPPPGTPARTIVACGLSTPISLITASLAGAGILVAVFILCTLLLYRNHHVFKSSSPIFCALELTGFILSYVSILVLFSYSDSVFNCFMLPITFYVSVSIILGTTMARNYSVYRVVNNIHIASKDNGYHKMSHPMQLLKIVACTLTVNCFILTLWLIFAEVQLVLTSVSATVSIASCSYEGRGHTVFIVLLSTAAGIELCFSVFLAFRTKSFGGYSKHSEHKQLGVSVFNIFFSALIGSIIFFMPTTDFYTRHYLTAMTILWASTFSMGVLFFPKLYRFIRTNGCKEEKKEYYDEEKVTMNHVLAALDDDSSKCTLICGQDGTFLLDSYTVKSYPPPISCFVLTHTLLGIIASTACLSLFSLFGKMANAIYYFLSASTLFCISLR